MCKSIFCIMRATKITPLTRALRTLNFVSSSESAGNCQDHASISRFDSAAIVSRSTLTPRITSSGRSSSNAREHLIDLFNDEITAG